MNDGRGALALDAVEKQFGRQAANFILRQFHGREGRIEQAEPGIIIQGDQAEILRTPHAHLLGGLQKANRH